MLLHSRAIERKRAVFSAESPIFSAIPLKIAPLFGGEAALQDARCGTSCEFRETLQWGQKAISFPRTIVKRLLCVFQEGICHFVKVGSLRDILPDEPVRQSMYGLVVFLARYSMAKRPKADRNILPPTPGKRRRRGIWARMLASALSARTKGNGILAGTS